MTSRVTLEIKNGVADVRLNRPDKLNAIDVEMFDALLETGKMLHAASDVRAVVLSGNGRSFSVGIDLPSLQAGGGERMNDLLTRTYGNGNDFQQVVLQWRTMPMPVIAAVSGYALGGGFQLMLGADIRIIAPDANLAVREVHWGLVTGMAGTVIMRSLVRDDVIRDLVYTAREFSGRDAAHYGLATRLSDTPLDSAFELAYDIASSSPTAVRSAKRLLNAASSGMDEASLLMAESVELQDLLRSSDHKEALAAYVGKRLPQFADEG
jgi:enoyl-CoA hydratase/carnithine racemase